MSYIVLVTISPPAVGAGVITHRTCIRHHDPSPRLLHHCPAAPPPGDNTPHFLYTAGNTKGGKEIRGNCGQLSQLHMECGGGTMFVLEIVIQDTIYYKWASVKMTLKFHFLWSTLF